MVESYSLLVESADQLIWKPHRLQNADLYITVTDGFRTVQSAVEPESLTPRWRFESKFPSDSSAIELTIRLFHKSAMRSNKLLGESKMKIADLLQLCISNNVVALDLKAKGDFAGRVFVRLSLYCPSTKPTADMQIDLGQIDSNRRKLAHASGVIESVESGVEIAGPGEEMVNSIGKVVSQLEPIVKMVDEVSKIHPYLNVAWKILTSVYHAAKKLHNTDHEVNKLVKAMVDLYSSAGEIDVLKDRIKSLNDTVVDIACTTKECAEFLETYVSAGVLARAAQVNFLTKHRGEIDALSEKMLELKEAFDRNVGMQTLLHADSLKQSELLKTLSPIDLDASQRSPCLERTREDILAKIISWLTVPPANSNVLWLSGVAGSGKSTIAASIAKHFRELDALGAFVFFSRNKENSPRAVLHGIANGLAMLNPGFKATLCHALESFSNVNADINTQFQKLLLDPLNANPGNCNIIVILDALDECSDDEWRRTLISLIANDFSRLPRNIRFFITSRRNRDISAPFGSKSHISELSLDISDDKTKADILLYLDHRFKGIRAEQNIQNDRWPESHTLESLAKYAGGLFIWAATACSLIRDAYDPDDMLKNLLAKDSDVANNLDGLYTVALGTSGKWNDKHFVRKAPAVLAVVILARVPLTDKSMDLLLGYQDGESAKILSQLGCVIQWAPNQPTRTLHASFADYLTDPEHIGTQSWFVDSALGHRYLALGCLEVLRKQLKFNICGLESSYVLNSELEDLNTRIQQFISPELSYASQFWTTHLDNVEVAEDTDPLLVAVNNCFPGHFLYWLEVLSLLGHVNIAHTNLDIPKRVLHGKNVNLESFFVSAQDFLDGFGPVIAQSVPHIYLSAVPFSAKESLVHSHFGPKLSNILKYEWPSHRTHIPLRKIIPHTARIWCIAISPDGRHITSGSDDDTVCIWDVATGKAVCAPLKGHTSSVLSIVFSPDGKYIASGSNDKTVCIWDAMTGEAVSPPLKGHSDTINSVVFSPDGKHIASGSYDCTVHIWDVMTHKSVGGPLSGHTSSVQSVIFSPDGRHIVSGSGDKTVRIWDAATGEAVGTPLTGHTGGIYSVAFSPDEKHIVSGSLDRTIRIWNIASGQAVAAPLEGHTNWVRSVAFSPDGMYIISGSDDHTVRIWDAITHKAVGTPLTGHTKWVRSVAFTPNGKYVVSGSDDRTIRIWDATGEVVVASLTKGQTIGVNSVVFSPDGKQIASGSDDDTVGIWDVVTGKAVCAPLKGHTSSVLSVVFSPDGKYIASGSKDKTVCIWDAITGEAVDPSLKGHSDTINTVVFSPDGKHIASGSNDGTVHVWDMTTHKNMGAPLKGHTSSVQSVIFSPDGRHIASGSRDKTVRIWQAATGEAAGTPLRGHTNSIRCVAFSPDGKHIVSGSTDRTIRIWDMASGQAVGAPLQGHTGWVRSVAFSPDGMYIISGSEDHTVRIWDAVTHKTVGTPLKGHTDWVKSVAFSPNGQCIVSGSDDRTIRIWDAMTGEVVGTPSKRLNNLVQSPSQNVLWATHAMLEDGWLKDSNSRRMFWVPAWLRENFCFPWNSVVISEYGTTKLDLTYFVHGTEWTKCMNHD